jgi:hypothetical protein
MVIKLSQKLIATLLLLTFTLGITGCDNSEFKQQISDFQESVGLLSSAVGTYYTEMNQYERDLYLQNIHLNPEKMISAEPTDPENVFGPFSGESIKARMDAITLLGRYGQRLAELAGTDAPERFSSASQELGTNLFNLSNTFSNLVGKGDASAKDFVTPVATIVGVIGKLILESKRDKKLRMAIEEAAPAVRTVIDLLEKDFTNVIVPQRISGNPKGLSDLIFYYNCLDRTGTPPATPFSDRCPKPPIKATADDRRELLDKINQATQQLVLFKTSTPTAAISNMRDAHEALVQYASNRNPRNLTALISALDSFKSSAEQVAAAVIQIRNLRRGES